MFKKYQSPQLHSKTFTDLILKKKVISLYSNFLNGELKELKDLKKLGYLKKSIFFFQNPVLKSFGCGLADFGKISR